MILNLQRTRASSSARAAVRYTPRRSSSTSPLALGAATDATNARQEGTAAECNLLRRVTADAVGGGGRCQHEPRAGPAASHVGAESHVARTDGGLGRHGVPVTSRGASNPHLGAHSCLTPDPRSSSTSTRRGHLRPRVSPLVPTVFLCCVDDAPRAPRRCSQAGAQAAAERRVERARGSYMYPVGGALVSWAFSRDVWQAEHARSYHCCPDEPQPRQQPAEPLPAAAAASALGACSHKLRTTMTTCRAPSRSPRQGRATRAMTESPAE